MVLAMGSGNGCAAAEVAEIDLWTNLPRPQYFGKRILSAETDISISEDPSFRFFFKPHAGGTMIAEMTDSKGRRFTHSFEVEGTAVKVTR